MDEIYDLNKLNLISGISENEASARLKREGYNEIPSAKKRSLIAITFGVVREPMLLLLIAGGIIYLILGDIQEALLLLFFVVVIIGITLYPNKSYIEATIKLFNRTAFPHSILYWANVAVYANDDYHIIFPPRTALTDMVK
jgi:Ca2+-transporting ATPase